MGSPGLSRRLFLLGAAALARSRLAWAQEGGQPVVLILSTDADPRTVEIVRVFKEGLSEAVRMSYQIDPQADSGAYIADLLRGQPVDLVFAVGDAATGIARREFAQVPLVVCNASQVDVSDRPDAHVVPTRVDPGVGMDHLASIMPALRKLGVIRATSDLDPYWARLGAAAEARGLTLVERRVGSPVEAVSATRELRLTSDLIWIQKDDRLWTPDVVSTVLHEAWLERFPMVTYDRAHLTARMPLALAMECKTAGIGEAAAAIARAVLSGDATQRAPEPAPVVLASLAGFRNCRLSVSAQTRAAIDEFVDAK